MSHFGELGDPDRGLIAIPGGSPGSTRMPENFQSAIPFLVTTELSLRSSLRIFHDREPVRLLQGQFIYLLRCPVLVLREPVVCPHFLRETFWILRDELHVMPVRGEDEDLD